MPLGPKPGTAPVRRIVRRPPAPSPDLAETTRGHFKPVPDREETPPPRRRARGDDDTAEANFVIMGVGRAGAAAVAKSTPSNYAEKFPVPDDPLEDPVLIKFIGPTESCPAVSWAQHWCDWMPKKKSYVCIGAESCPLCAIGDNPAQVTAYNVVDLRDPDNLRMYYLQAGKALEKDLAALDRKRGTQEYGELVDDGNYYSIIRMNNNKGDKGVAVTRLSKVKERDLVDDWATQALTDDQLQAFEEKAWKPKDFITADSRDELQAVADSAPS
jgi:hypothetical protein